MQDTGFESAEDFLQHFGIDYSPAVVHVHRLHILKRFHDYLQRAGLDASEDSHYTECANWMRRAYQDFVVSDAQSERVFAVFRRYGPQPVHFMPRSAAPAAGD